MSGFVSEAILSESQKIVIGALISGKSVTDACKAGDISRQQYYDWMRTSQPFTEALETAKSRAWQEVLMRPAFLAETSLDTLAELCTPEANTKNANIRLRAASILLETLWKASQVSMLDQRLTAIEEALGLEKPDFIAQTPGPDRTAITGNPSKSAEPDNNTA